MNKHLPFIQWQLGLPDIDSIENTEHALGDAFLVAAQVLYKHLQEIKATVEGNEEFSREQFNSAILCLFSKMCRNYYSYVLLEVNKDHTGSQLLIEHLSEAAITLTYLLEEADTSIFSDYIATSMQQAYCLLNEVNKELQELPHHPDLLILKEQLETVINNQKQYTASLIAINSVKQLWGLKEADTTAKRGRIIGLNFLITPARKIALKVESSSWLDLQLSYLNSTQQHGINFTHLRDSAHLCLHATRAFIEEVVNHQGVKVINIEHQQHILNTLYEWFYNAHNLSQLYCRLAD